MKTSGPDTASIPDLALTPEQVYEDRLEQFLDTRQASYEFAYEKAADDEKDVVPTVQEQLQEGLKTWRNSYAEAIADNSASRLGLKVQKSQNEELETRR